MNKYLNLLRVISISEKTLQSDFARANSHLVAEAASRGHITSLNSCTQRHDGRWYITFKGSSFLYEVTQ